MQDSGTVSRAQAARKPGGDYRDLKNSRFWPENEIPVVPTGSNTTFEEMSGRCGRLRVCTMPE